ncbi:S9 family peptidase [Hephaestia mangrovi]|uniref:S9 family peptidase n=1 Tax=Hephaestia mangrovi TaxID=2873268 RepID=UPI001CA5FA91|nr:prolyl oligopeptidase family serine peptidase [Hephaestia mangrovi]MBY8829156.1 prolyl oligopeptidase family serine peptidase [Hephaestia mangrovi]
MIKLNKVTRLAVSALALSVSSAAVATAGRSVHGDRHKVTFDDMVKIPYNAITTIDLSGDGKHVAEDYNRKIRIIDATSGKVVNDIGEGVLPLWSPNGKYLALYSIRNGTMQLWAWRLGAPSAWQLTSFPHGVDPDPLTRVSGFPLEAFRFDWSPDSSKIVFASRESYAVRRAENEPMVLDGTSSIDSVLSGVFTRPGIAEGGVVESSDGWRFDVRKPDLTRKLVNRLHIVDVASGKEHTVESGPGAFFHPVFSPDGNMIAYASIAENTKIVTAKSGEIRLLDLRSGRETVLASGLDLKFQPRWSPDGKRLAFLVGNYGAKPTIRIVDARTGHQLKDYALGIFLQNYQWTDDGNGLLLSYVVDHVKTLGRLSFGKDAPKPLYSHIGYFWSRAGDGSLAWLEPRPNSEEMAADSEIFLGSVRGKARRKLASLAPPPKHDLELGRIQTISYRTAAGFDLNGALLYPPDYVPGRRYPLIVDAYPQYSGAGWMFPMYGNQAWAAAGYMVFKPYQARAPHVWVNCTGAADYCAASKGPKGWDTMKDDVMSGVDELVRRGLVDPGRMCVYGHSNGGGVADYLITQTPRFKCAVIVAPVIPNWTGEPLLYGEWGMLSQWAGVSPLDDADAWVRLSAVFRAKNVTTPVLLADGDDDGSFLLGTIEMYQALRYAGKKVTLLRYPNQGHVFEGAGLRDLYNREMAFFAKYLRPDEDASTQAQ